MVTFGGQGYDRIWLDDPEGWDKVSLQAKIDRIVWEDQSTNTSGGKNKQKHGPILSKMNSCMKFILSKIYVLQSKYTLLLLTRHKVYNLLHYFLSF